MEGTGRPEYRRKASLVNWMSSRLNPGGGTGRGRFAATGGGSDQPTTINAELAEHAEHNFSASVREFVSIAIDRRRR